MAHPARLSLRAPPHLPFIQGFPGIPPSPSRKPAGVHGTLELRVGTQPVKAKWVRVELRRYESLPPGFPGPAVEPTWEHVGEIQTLWQPKTTGKEWDTVETADFKFFLPLPENLPPSVDLPRSAGVRYELVAALCYRQKGGMFKKESAQVIKVVEQLRITKHELHSAWPVYNVPETRGVKAANGQINLTVSRPSTACASGDRIQLTATLKSTRSQPFKLKGFECVLIEVITYIPPPPDLHSTKSKKSKVPAAPVVKSRPISTVRAPIDETVGLGGEKSTRIEMEVGGALVTVKGAKTLEVAYELEIKAVTEGFKDKVEMVGIVYTVGPFARGHAQQATKDIGYVEKLCPGVPKPDSIQPRTSSIPPFLQNGGSQLNSFVAPRGSYQPQQQGLAVQGFTPNHHRHSSITSTATDTTTTATTATHEFGAGNAGGPAPRSYQTVPNQRRAEVAFPSPQPHRPRSTELDSPAVSPAPERFTLSDAGHGDDSWKRYSTGTTATTATFGRWDKGLKTAMDPKPKDDGAGNLNSLVEGEVNQSPITPTSARPNSTRTPPSSYPYQSAEQEKKRQQDLYDSARARAAAVQHASGASLDRLGLAPEKPTGSGSGSSAAVWEKGVLPADEEEAPPPEYAPPRPAHPGVYKAPARPVSVYSEHTSPRPADSPLQAPLAARAASPPPPPPPPAPSSVDALYLSAAEEKAAQRRRYDEATGRVASLSLGQTSREGSSNGHASGESSQNPVPASPGSARRRSAVRVTPNDAGPIPYNAVFPPSQSSSALSNGTATPTPGNTSFVPGLSEKDQMKRFYEAQDQVAKAATKRDLGEGGADGQSGGSGSGSGVPRSMSTGSLLGGAGGAPAGQVDEKEQMRRYYEAQDRVAAAAGGSASGSSGVNRGQSSPAKLVAAQVPPTVAPAVDEKEQMRRYYEAQERVAAAGGSGSGSGSQPVPAPRPRTSLPPAAPSAAPASGALDEKEQMRRYYAAQERVAAAAGGASGSGSRTPPSRPLSTQPQSFAPGPVDEKEQMRRYYEAQEKVAAAANGGGGGSGSGSGWRVGSSTQHSPVRQSSVPNSGQTTPQRGPQPSYNEPPVSPRPAGAVLSAFDEKEQMRRYYEAMNRVQAGEGSGSGSGSGAPGLNGPAQSSNGGGHLPSTPSSATRPRNPSNNPFTQSTPNGSNSTPPSNRPLSIVTNTSSPPGSPLWRDPAVQAGKERAVNQATGDDRHAGPPPPLPARPPREYINLLSPLGE